MRLSCLNKFLAASVDREYCQAKGVDAGRAVACLGDYSSSSAPSVRCLVSPAGKALEAESVDFADALLAMLLALDLTVTQSA